MVGFFHVYGMQTHELEGEMVKQIGLIEKEMMGFKTDSNDQKNLENFTKINSCQDYLTLLDQEVLKNLMIRIRTYIEDKDSGMVFWSKMHQPQYFNSLDSVKPYEVILQEYRTLNEGKDPGEKSIIRQAICDIVKKYFSSFLTNQISTSSFFNRLFEFQAIYLYLLGTQPAGQPPFTKFDVIDYILNIRFRGMIESVKEFQAKKQNVESVGEFKDLLSSIVSASKLRYIDPNISVDLLLTSWLERRMAEFEAFMRSTSSFTKEGFQIQKKIFHANVENEHRFVVSILEAAKFYQFQMTSNQSGLDEPQSQFVYMFAMQKYEALTKLPLGYAENIMPRVIREFQVLNGRFFFAKSSELNFDTKTKIEEITHNILSYALNYGSAKARRDALFANFCEELLPDTALQLLWADNGQAYLQLLDNNILDGVSPISLYVLAIVNSLFKKTTPLSLESVKDATSKIDHNLRFASMFTQIAQQIQITKKIALSMGDFGNLMLLGFFYASKYGDNWKIEMMTQKALELVEHALAKGIQMFGFPLDHYEVVDNI